MINIDLYLCLWLYWCVDLCILQYMLKSSLFRRIRLTNIKFLYRNMMYFYIDDNTVYAWMRQERVMAVHIFFNGKFRKNVHSFFFLAAFNLTEASRRSLPTYFFYVSLVSNLIFMFKKSLSYRNLNRPSDSGRKAMYRNTQIYTYMTV